VLARRLTFTAAEHRARLVTGMPKPGVSPDLAGFVKEHARVVKVERGRQSGDLPLRLRRPDRDDLLPQITDVTVHGPL